MASPMMPFEKWLLFWFRFLFSWLLIWCFFYLQDILWFSFISFQLSCSIRLFFIIYPRRRSSFINGISSVKILFLILDFIFELILRCFDYLFFISLYGSAWPGFSWLSLYLFSLPVFYLYYLSLNWDLTVVCSSWVEASFLCFHIFWKKSQ